SARSTSNGWKCCRRPRCACPARARTFSNRLPRVSDIVADAAEALAVRTASDRHDVAIVLGSGWIPALDGLGPASAEFATTELPGFLPPAVEGHAGRIRSLDYHGVRLLCFLGRTHLYEGRGVDPVVHAVRVAAAAGCRVVILTNACGGLRA